MRADSIIYQVLSCVIKIIITIIITKIRFLIISKFFCENLPKPFFLYHDQCRCSCFIWASWHLSIVGLNSHKVFIHEGCHCVQRSLTLEDMWFLVKPRSALSIVDQYSIVVQFEQRQPFILLNIWYLLKNLMHSNVYHSTSMSQMTL